MEARRRNQRRLRRKTKSNWRKEIGGGNGAEVKKRRMGRSDRGVRGGMEGRGQGEGGTEKKEKEKKRRTERKKE